MKLESLTLLLNSKIGLSKVVNLKEVGVGLTITY
jgi:hypothetical protein